MPTQRSDDAARRAASVPLSGNTAHSPDLSGPCRRAAPADVLSVVLSCPALPGSWHGRGRCPVKDDDGKPDRTPLPQKNQGCGEMRTEGPAPDEVRALPARSQLPPTIFDTPRKAKSPFGHREITSASTAELSVPHENLPGRPHRPALSTGLQHVWIRGGWGRSSQGRGRFSSEDPAAEDPTGLGTAA